MWGVVVVEDGRCTFASDVLTRAEADALAVILGPPAVVVDVATLRLFKRSMMEGR